MESLITHRSMAGKLDGMASGLKARFVKKA
jgi:hypothetical protein